MTIKIFGGSHLIHEFTKQYDGHYLGVLHVMDPSTCEDTIINRDVYTIRRLARLKGGYTMLGKNLSALMNEDTILYYLNIYRGHIYREYPSGHITKADPADVIQARGALLYACGDMYIDEH